MKLTESQKKRLKDIIEHRILFAWGEGLKGKQKIDYEKVANWIIEDIQDEVD